MRRLAGVRRIAGASAPPAQAGPWQHPQALAASLPSQLVGPADGPWLEAMAQVVSMLRERPARTLRELAQPIADALAHGADARVVLLGHLRATHSQLDLMAVAGPARAEVEGLQISRRVDLPHGRGASGAALRSGQPQHWYIDEPRSAERVSWLRRLGAVGMLAVPQRTHDAECLLLCVAHAAGRGPRPGMLEALQYLVVRLARLAELEAQAARSARRAAYSDAWASLRPLLQSAASRHDVRRAVGDAWLRFTDVRALELWAPVDGVEGLRALHPAGLAAEPAALALAVAARRGAGAELHERAWASGLPEWMLRPPDDGDLPPLWRDPALAAGGAIVAWPIVSAGTGRRLGVLRLVVADPAPWDPGLRDIFEHMVEDIAAALERAGAREASAPTARDDPVTGLPGRVALLRRLRRLRKPGHVGGRALTLGVLDLDDFQAVNQRWGPSLGDSLLYAFGARLQAAVPRAACVARVGADEFAVLLDDLPADEPLDEVARTLARDLRLPPGQALAGRALGEGFAFCMGLTRYPDDDCDPEQLLEHAYAALDAAKARRACRAAYWAVWGEPGTQGADAAAPRRAS